MMGVVIERKNGADLDKLTDKMRRFVLEYMVHGEGKRAAIAAGYKENSAPQKAHSLLQHPKVKAIIGKYHRETRERLQVEAGEILEQLVYCATRSGADYVDDAGRLIQNINDLPERAQQAIDGIEQEDFYNEDGVIIKTKVKLRLVSKLGAIDLGMKHKGLFAKETVDHTHKMVIDWDAMKKRPVVIDVLAQRRIEEQNNGS